MSTSKFSLASQLLLQSPPGELNDVFQSLRSLVSSDQELETQILPALKQYNLEQFTVVSFKNGKKGLITKEARVGESEGEEENFVDWREGKRFGFNHMTSTATEFEEISEEEMYDQATLDQVKEIDDLLKKYTENHYSEGVSRVYPLQDERYPRPQPQESEPQELKSQPEPETKEVEDDALVPEKEETDENVAEVAAEVGQVAEEVIKEGVEGSEAQDQAMEVSTPAPTAEEGVVEEKGEETMQEDQKIEVQPPVESTESTKEEEIAPPTPVAAAPQPRTSRLVSLCFVGNKYNPNNYWTGRWRSRYKVDLESGTIKGLAQINIHYYEQGNVQLSTQLTSSHTLGPSPSPTQIIASLKSSETNFQVSLNETYEGMSEEAFKGLRRALPKTRSKVDWNKAGGYRLGAELGGGN